MYTQAQLFDKLKQLKPMLYEKYGISRVGVFGSYAIGAQDEDSDVDIIVELTRPLGWAYFGLTTVFEEFLKVKVDVTTKEGLKPSIKNQVLKQLVYID
jgi:predicted nucleotidyltransferase